MPAARSVRAGVIVPLLMLGACAAPVAVLPDYHDAPSTTNFTVADLRPETDKTAEILSVWVTSCKYGIYRLADGRSNPPRMTLLRHDLESSLGGRLHNATLTVTQYRMYINKRAPLRATVNGSFTGVVPSVLAAQGEGCTKEKTGEGWFDASDTSANAALIVEIQAAMNGKSYSVRSVAGIVPPEQLSDSQQIFGSLQKANATLAEQIRKDLPPS